MIRHVVMFEFAKEAEGKTAYENAQIAKELFLALPSKVEVIRRLEVGINDKGADATNYTFCLTCDFDSLEDLDRYQMHPSHLEAAGFIGKVRTMRACVDYEI